MDSVKIKMKAKELIVNNKWNIWKPYLIILAITAVLSWIATGVFNIELQTREANFADGIISFITMPLSVGYIVYLLNFVRGKKYEINDIFSKMDKLIPIWVVNLIVAVLVALGFVCLIIPGIIIGLMFTMTTYLLADGEDNIGTILKKSSEMIKGYKWDYFVFSLSFLGWVLLSIVTLGIALIWVMPYISVSHVLYYEELKKKIKG